MTSEASYNYLLDNREVLQKKYNNCFIIIRDGKPVGIYTSEGDLEANSKKHGPDTLIVHITDQGIKVLKD